MKPTVDEVRDHCVSKLVELETLFCKEARLTFVMRVPGDQDAFILITADDPKEVGELLIAKASSMPESACDKQS